MTESAIWKKKPANLGYKYKAIATLYLTKQDIYKCMFIDHK